MKKIINLVFNPLILMGVFVVLLYNCEKDSDSAEPNTVINEDGKTGTVTDVEGYTYPIVKIGDQWWMAENLKTTKYNDGKTIPLITDTVAWGNLTTPGYTWYKNDQSTFGNTYGALYNWYTVHTGKLCPAGWHIPSDAEWTTLVDFLEGEYKAGGKMKETGTTHWANPNYGATNETGFAALPGGYLDINGTFGGIGKYGYWWSDTEYFTGYAWYRTILYSTSSTKRYNINEQTGFSVRCVKN